jgi:hypothetical protein
MARPGIAWLFVEPARIAPPYGSVGKSTGFYRVADGRAVLLCDKSLFPQGSHNRNRA